MFFLILLLNSQTLFELDKLQDVVEENIEDAQNA